MFAVLAGLWLTGNIPLDKLGIGELVGKIGVKGGENGNVEI
jgi:hypothetical protein